MHDANKGRDADQRQAVESLLAADHQPVASKRRLNTAPGLAKCSSTSGQGLPPPETAA